MKTPNIQDSEDCIEYSLKTEKFLLQELHLTVRRTVDVSFKLPTNQIFDSGVLHETFRAIWDEDISLRERMYILLLNRSNKPIGYYMLSAGSAVGTVVCPSMIFQCAFACGAVGIVLAHNHPSGNLNPSKADIDLTRKIKAGADYLNLIILDHLILVPENELGQFTYTSFADGGLM